MINNPRDRWLQIKSLNPQDMAGKLPVSVTIILPTRNEEEALGPTVDSIPRNWCDELEIMIDDLLNYKERISEKKQSIIKDLKWKN